MVVAASALVIAAGKASWQSSSLSSARSVASPGCSSLTTADRLRRFFVRGSVVAPEGSPCACSVASHCSSGALSVSGSPSLSASATVSVGCGTRNASIDVASVCCVLLRASKSPSATVLWLSSRLHSCIIAMPLPEKTLMAPSVLIQLSPVARNTPSSQAENHIVRLAQKMNRRILCRARWARVVSAASGALSASEMRRIPAMKGCMTGPRAS